MKWPVVYSVTKRSGCRPCCCILLNFFNAWTAVECEGRINKASSSVWRIKLPVYWSVTSHILWLPGSSGHPRCRQLWEKYKSNNLSGIWCDCCDWHGIEARVSMLFAWTARRPPVADKLWATGGRRAAFYSRPFRRHRKTILEIIIAILHCFERKACLLLAYMRWWLHETFCCEFGLCQWVTHMWEVRLFTILSDLVSLHDRETSVALVYKLRY